MNPEQYKKEREALYEKAFKLHQLACKGEGGERENAEKFYRKFISDNSLDHKIVLEIEKFKAVKPKKTFEFEGMEFVSFEEFKKWFEANKDTISFLQRVKLMRKIIFNNK